MVCAFGQLIREPLLSEAPTPASIPPRLRGVTIKRAIMAGEERHRGCGGPRFRRVALCEELPIGPEEDFEALAANLAALGGELSGSGLRPARRRKLVVTEQDDDAATYAEKIAPEERRLDPSARWLSWPGAFVL